MDKEDKLQITLRIRDKDLVHFLKRKIKKMKTNPRIKGRASYQSVIEGLLMYWMEIDDDKSS